MNKLGTRTDSPVVNRMTKSGPANGHYYGASGFYGNAGAFKPRKGLSYLSVPGEGPLCDRTVGELVVDAAELFGSAEGLYDRAVEARLTFRDINKETDALAAGFLSLGFKKGDRVGIWGRNSRRWYITQLALAKVGIVSVTVNPASQPSELLYCINKVKMKGLVFGVSFKGENLFAILNEALPELEASSGPVIKSEVAPWLCRLILMEDDPAACKSALAYYQVIDCGRKFSRNIFEQAKRSVSLDDVFCIQFTSGTTGKPKGVVQTHHNAVNSCQIVGKRFEFNAQDKLCLVPPMFHIFATVYGILPGLRYGFTLVLPSTEYEPVAAVQAIVEERCTVLIGTPTMHIDMVEAIKNGLAEAPTTLRKVLTAAATCPAELMRQMRCSFNVENIEVGYGMTEMTGACLGTLPGDSDELRTRTVGYPMEHFELKVINKLGEIVPIGEPGELCARSCTVMTGYWEDGAKTREVIDANRWFHTGDLFVMEPSGHCGIVGRIKDIIIRGGENISPREVEDILYSHPAIMEAHVFGLPHERLGEVVAVWIRLQEGEKMTADQLRLFCKGKISAYKIPMYIKFTSKFPKTESGKVRKHEMREITARELGLKQFDADL